MPSHSPTQFASQNDTFANQQGFSSLDTPHNSGASTPYRSIPFGEKPRSSSVCGCSLPTRHRQLILFVPAGRACHQHSFHCARDGSCYQTSRSPRGDPNGDTVSPFWLLYPLSLHQCHSAHLKHLTRYVGWLYAPSIFILGSIRHLAGTMNAPTPSAEPQDSSHFREILPGIYEDRLRYRKDFPAVRELTLLLVR